MTCTNCGTDLAGGASRCPQCGHDVQGGSPPPADGILCECGAVSTRQHHFCVSCGARLSHADPLPAPPARTGEPLGGMKTELPAWLRAAPPGPAAASPAPSGEAAPVRQRMIPLPIKTSEAEPAAAAPAPTSPAAPPLSAGPTKMLELTKPPEKKEPVPAAAPVAPTPAQGIAIEPPLVAAPVRTEATPIITPPVVEPPVVAPVAAPVPTPAPAPAAAPVAPLAAPATMPLSHAALAEAEEEAPAPPAFFGKLKSIRTGKVYELKKEINTMGRRSPTEGIEPDIDCTVMDDDFFCSRRHARVLAQGGVYYAEDLGSANGTYLNNAALAPHSPTPMKEGDRLRLGNVEFVFTLGQEGAARRSTAEAAVADAQALIINQSSTAAGRAPLRMSVDLQAMEKHLRTVGHQTRDLEIGGYRVHIDLSSQVLGIHMPEEQVQGRREPALLSTLPLQTPLAFMSSSILALKAQTFNLGLQAAIELAAEAGFGSFPGKAAMLKRLATVLSGNLYPELHSIAEVLFGAMVVGELDTEPPRGLVNNVINRVTEFRSHEEASLPVDFYTFNRELESIYKQDRMLETPLGGQQAVYDLVRMMAADKSLRESYEAALSLIHSMTHAPGANQRDLGAYLQLHDEGRMEAETGAVSFFPPHGTHPGYMVHQLLGEGAAPDLGAVLDDVVRELRAGRTMLTPTERSGWFDYLTWALEPLISPERMPEASQLHQADSYRRQLQDVFKEHLFLTRDARGRTTEGHLPPVPSERSGHQTVLPIEPAVTVEPTASYYLRQAVAYRFVRLILEALFGREGLQAMHRMSVRGPVAEGLEEDLQLMESIFYGAHVVACQELGLATDGGLPVGSGGGPATDAARFVLWMQQLNEDPDVGGDIRTMLPVGYDAQQRKLKVWLSMGWASRPIRFYFFEQPIATVMDASGRPVQDGQVSVQFREVQHTLWYPVTAVTYVDKMLPPDRFRSVCTANGNATSIIQAVTGR